MDTISKLEVTGVQRNLLLKRVNAQGTTGEVGADDQQNDSMYLCPVQTLNLDFDTGSSDLWVSSIVLKAFTYFPVGTQERCTNACDFIRSGPLSSTNPLSPLAVEATISLTQANPALSRRFRAALGRSNTATPPLRLATLA